MPKVNDLHLNWLLLRIYNYYKISIIAIIFLLWFFKLGSLGKSEPIVFIIANSCHAIVTLVTLSLAYLKKPSFDTQTTLQVFCDLTIITFVIFASGGVYSGATILMIPIIAATCLLTPGKLSFLYTAIASIFLLAEQVYDIQIQTAVNSSYTVAGLHGMAMFIVAASLNIVHSQLSSSAAVTKKQSKELLKLAQLSEIVIGKLPIGVLVVDTDSKIYTINAVAKQLLHYNKQQYLHEISSKIAEEFDIWRQYQIPKKHIRFSSIALNIEFKALDPNQRAASLIFIEDLSWQNKRLEELKLNAMAKLTANIAHEIRNPLAAISHASQLLPKTANNSEFIDIITNNITRTNDIINKVLLLSKQNKTNIQKINLADFIKKFVASFLMPEFDNLQIHTQLPSQIMVFFDLMHLSQILTNLCENGIRYSYRSSKVASLNIICHCHRQHDKIMLDINDQGNGVAAKHLSLLFEPFFTTEKRGTGLGLFIASELCQANGATLEYKLVPKQGSTFRITFNSR